VSAAGVRREQRSPADYGLPRCASADLAGADAVHNARELRRVLCGERLAGADAGRDPHRDALLLGTALALEVCGQESSPRAAMARAAQAIESGRGAALLAKLTRFGADELRRSSAA
jgi:anthranilate phosphoribosyltransferase